MWSVIVSDSVIEHGFMEAKVRKNLLQTSVFIYFLFLQFASEVNTSLNIKYLNLKISYYLEKRIINDIFVLEHGKSISQIMNGLISEFDAGKLHVKIYDTPANMGTAAALWYLDKVKKKLEGREYIRAVFAAARSQEDFFNGLIEDDSVDFSKIEAFHMDEYIGLPDDAPQRFGNFLMRMIFGRKPFRNVNLMKSEAGDCARYSSLLKAAPIDIVSLGIGENGHIAFNDPHEARFDDPETVKVTTLDDICRQQQVNDGEFASIDLVPEHALTMTIPALMACMTVVGVVPHERKAEAVRNALTGPVSESCPASILRTHDDAVLFLDKDAASLL